MIAEGGDTDTNAAIVGGLIGAWQGLSAVTPDQTMILFKARCDLREWKGR
jgi:ADP-ribosylglycohydrolase